MEEIQSLMHGFAIALSLKNLVLMFAGVILGVIIGVLPGLGGANGVAILLPLTFSMAQSPGGTTSAIILLSCIYWGALFGGAITSILFALMHYEHTHLYALAVFPVGVALGFVRERYASIKASAFFHGLYNLFSWVLIYLTTA